MREQPGNIRGSNMHWDKLLGVELSRISHKPQQNERGNDNKLNKEYQQVLKKVKRIGR